jgi:hypothetical protein
MEKIDFSPLQTTANEMAIKLAILLGTPFIIALVVKFILVKIRVPNYLANIISTGIFLLTAYKMIPIVLG